MRASGGRGEPLFRDVCLASVFAVAITLAGDSSAQVRALEEWRAAAGCIDTVDLEIFIQEFPESPFVDEARALPGHSRKFRKQCAHRYRKAARLQERTPEELEALLALTFEQRALIQHGLVSLGYDVSILDGVFGSRTRLAIAGYQHTKGLPSTGFLTSEQSDGLTALGRARERHAWLDARNANTHAAIRDYLSAFRLGAHSDEAYTKLAELENSERSFDKTQNTF